MELLPVGLLSEVFATLAPMSPEVARRRAEAAGKTGVYGADASLLPTALGVNPMLTIMLLAERTARAVLADGARLGAA